MCSSVNNHPLTNVVWGDQTQPTLHDQLLSQGWGVWTRVFRLAGCGIQQRIWVQTLTLQWALWARHIVRPVSVWFQTVRAPDSL